MLRLNILLMLALILLVSGCSQSLYMQGRRHLDDGRFDPAIDAFYKEIAANPTNHKAWRELGVAFYEKGDLVKAEDALKQSGGMKPDARAELYLGMIYEQQDDFRRAIQAYSVSLGLESRGKTATMVRARRDGLVSKQIAAEVALAVENEAAIDVGTIPEHTIGVADFDGSNLPADLAPLARGLSEFTATDLSKVTGLTVVERQRLTTILKELEFSQSAYVDPTTAPRIGKLLGSRRLVTGTVLGLGDDGLSLDGAVVDALDGSADRTETLESRLSRVFELQKEFVFQIIAELGVELTLDERDEIEQVPTESYLAFLAYSRGLDYDDRGMPQAAAREYAAAVKHDPGFAMADRRLTAASAAADGGPAGTGPLDQFEGAIKKESPMGDISGDLATILTNLSNTGGNIPTGGSIQGTIPAIVPPLGGIATGSIIIRGTIDAD